MNPEHDLPRKTREIQSHHFDSTLWNNFSFRNDDIIIAAHAKSGSTWAAQIVAQLLFNGQPELCVHDVSVTLDLRVPPPEVKLDILQNRQHRRLLKSHLPVDAIVFSPKAKYIFVGRDARDIIWSLHNHHLQANHLWYDLFNKSPGLVGPPIEPPPADVREYWHTWLERDCFPWENFWDLVRSWWNLRHMDNVLIVHYADLRRDMPAQIRRIARYLGIPIQEDSFESILKYCSFDWMKQHADLFAPAMGQLWEGGSQTFINKGCVGRWMDILSASECQNFEQIAMDELGPDCARWMMNGGVIS